MLSRIPHPNILIRNFLIAICVIVAHFWCAGAHGQDANPLTRQWTSENGVYTRFGTLVGVTPTHAQLEIDGARITVRGKSLCICDRRFLARLENTDLKDHAAVVASLVGFHIECALREGFQLQTIGGIVIDSGSIRSISPVEMEYVAPDGWTTVVRCSDLTPRSQDLLNYDVRDEATYKEAHRKLKSRRNIAFKACKLLTSEIQVSPDYTRETYDTRYEKTVLRKTWGYVWKHGKLVDGAYTPGSFMPNTNDAFLDFWAKQAKSTAYATALQTFEDRKRAKKQASAEARRRRQVAARASRRQLNSLARSRANYGGYSYGFTRTYSVRKTWVNSYYRRDGTHVRGHWRYYD